MTMIPRGLVIAGSFALLLVASDVVDASERNRGPGPLLSLMAQSDVIAVAAFKAQEPPPKGIVLLNSKTNLRFRLVRTFAGTTKAKTVLLPVRVGRTKYSILHGAKRVLLFLKKGKDGKLKLAGLPGYHGCIRLEGDNAGLAKDLEQYLTIRRDRHKGAKGRQAFRTFLIGKVATSKSEYFRRNMAYDLWAMVNRVRKPGFSKKDIEAIAKAALSEKSYSVAAPLCRALDQLGSDKADDCILHALLDIPFRGAPADLGRIIVRRKHLLSKLLAKLKDVKDPGRISWIARHFLRQVPDAKAHLFYRELWQKNPAARPALKGLLARYELERQLLLELEAQAPVPKPGLPKETPPQKPKGTDGQPPPEETPPQKSKGASVQPPSERDADPSLKGGANETKQPPRSGVLALAVPLVIVILIGTGVVVFVLRAKRRKGR